ncbi:hypothetical protein [Microbulbifer sp. YPW16]|uniref:hypothetical protein n=1 Tax=Microbulbifer sp. YPW16 TaxID=2904242 RepID=UPI001E401174|nr:hypothetical protein [Microbulbifer sp. YPW16]UHQ54303.1 hypothetical protein LVE68_12345 [Microbulbifer sp. YPW16]
MSLPAGARGFTREWCDTVCVTCVGNTTGCLNKDGTFASNASNASNASICSDPASAYAVVRAGTGGRGLDCPVTATNLSEVVDFKMLHLFHLQGRVSYRVNQLFYPPPDLEGVYARVFLPASHSLLGYLRKCQGGGNRPPLTAGCHRARPPGGTSPMR